MEKQILIISFYNKFANALGVELELAQHHISKGDAVTFLVCGGGCCISNPKGIESVCKKCNVRRMQGLDELSDKVGIYTIDLPEIQTPVFDTVEEYHAFKYDGQDMGYGAVSSANTLHCDPACDSPKARASIARFLQSSCRTYEAVKAFLHGKSFDKGYVFNGRFAEHRAAFRAMQQAGIDANTLGRGSSVNHYEIFNDSLPHNPDRLQQCIKETSPDDETAFFQEQRFGSPRWPKFPNYTKNQEQNKLPKQWDESRDNVVVFTSSEDETASIADLAFQNIYASQCSAVLTLATACPDIHFTIRIHPRQARIKNSSFFDLNDIRLPNVDLIQPFDNVSSYALMEQSRVTMTFGSTMGVEACYIGKPSILLAGSFYDQLNVCYTPETHADVLALLCDKSLKPKDKSGAIKYGTYLSTFGRRFEHYKPIDYKRGQFGKLALDDGGRKFKELTA